MINPRLSCCKECADALALVKEIDCKLYELSLDAYNNIIFALNLKMNQQAVLDLLNYKRILLYKSRNENYACNYSVNMIASKIKKYIVGCRMNCLCDNLEKTTTTTSTTIIPTTTTTSTLITTTTTSTTLITTTTTTTTISLACDATAANSGVGIVSVPISLASTGGTVIISVYSAIVPDKFEIVHNGIKKATSGMTVVNAGPFDNVYGTPPGNAIPPSDASVASIDQFITPNKGAIPNRNATFLAETGITGITAPVDQQLIWWTYTPSDFIVSPQVLIKITGVTATGSSWLITRKCSATTTTTTTT